MTALTLLFMAMGAYAFVRTGSLSRAWWRPAYVPAAVACSGTWRRSFELDRQDGDGRGHRGIIAVGGWLLVNNSSNDMLRQFRLEALLSQAEANKGSGAIRSSLTDRGLQIAGGSWLLGAGPGQAEGIIGSGTDALGISNLHNWWLETGTPTAGSSGSRCTSSSSSCWSSGCGRWPARPRPADALPGLRDVAGAARLDHRVRRAEQLGELRSHVDPVRARARRGLALAAGGAGASADGRGDGRGAMGTGAAGGGTDAARSRAA